MKHKYSIIAIIIIALTLFIANINDQKAASISIPGEMEATEQLREELRQLPNGSIVEMRFDSIRYVYRKLGEEEAMNEIRAYGFYDIYGNRCLDSRIIQHMVTYYNAFGSYVEELQAMGYTDVDYTPVLSPAPEESVTLPAATETPTSTPTAFTVTPLEPPKTMWATQQVNYRDGADTTYNKAGTLNQYDEISVSGIASTGWYQFSLDDGTTQVYASNNYFTDVDPANRSVIIDNPETGDFTYYKFSETDPFLIDKAIEQLEEEAEQKASEISAEEETESAETTEEITPKPETESIVSTSSEHPVTIEVIEEETEESSTASTSITETVGQLSWTYIITATILIGIIILAIVMVVKYSKKK